MTNKNERVRLGTRLKESREYRGYSQEEIARHLEVSRSAISQMESGNRRVEALELQKLSALYRCSMDELTGGANVYTSVQMVARAAKGLSEKDRNEVIRFARFLQSRSRNGGDE